MSFTPEQEQELIRLENGLRILAAALRQVRHDYADNQEVRDAVAARSTLVRSAMQEVETVLRWSKEEA